MTRGVDDVDDEVGAVLALAGTPDGGVLGEDGDALFLLKVTGVHDTVLNLRVRVENARLAQHGVHEGGLAVVDVRDDGDITEFSQ